MSSKIVFCVLLVLGAGAVLVVVLFFAAPAKEASPDTSPPSSPQMLPGGPGPAADIRVDFVDVTARAGIEFHHFNGATDIEYIMEVMGSGLGWLDYDQDGLMDLFLVQGSTVVPPHTKHPPPCQLFKNLGGGRFRDVTAEVGVGHTGCGQGVAVGDVNNDGFPDVFVTCFGKPNALYLNVSDGRGGRRFVDVTAEAGLADHPDWQQHPNYSTSAAFLDYDSDGLLDLFVCSYVKIDLANYPVCQTTRGRRGTCLPPKFAGTRCLLYRNNGNGTFTDMRGLARVDLPTAKALGVLALDLDDDGRTDLFVANDLVPNFLFRNTGGGSFQSVGPQSGCAVNMFGRPQGYMGVDADDLNGDGLPELFVTAFERETNTLFRNEGGGRFLDVTFLSGLGPPSWFMVGWGTCFFDVDRDGSPDLAVANGHVFRGQDSEGDPDVKYRQKAQLFLNGGQGYFRDFSRIAGAYFQERHVGRGLAYADYDNDGHMDLAFSNNGEKAALLHNETQTPYHWVRLELRGTKSNRDAIGAKVTLRAGGRCLVRHRKGGGSYLSANDPRLLIGLGTARVVDSLAIRWPSGLVQHVGPLEADHGYLVTEGKDEVEPRP